MKKKLQFLFSMVVLLCASVAVHAQVDITDSYLKNANLKTVDNGWNYYSDAFKYTDWKTDGDVAVVEFYSQWNSGEPVSITQKDFKFSQTITLPAGDYRIAVNAFYRNGNGDGTNEDKAWIFAGETKQNVVALSSAGVANYTGKSDLYKAANAFSLGDFSNAFDFTLNEETTLDVGFQGFFNLSLSWCILGPVKLYKYSLDAYITDYNKTVETAQALYNEPMDATVLQSMKDAVVDISSYTKSADIQAAIHTLNEAIAEANNSIAEYAKVKAAIDENATKVAELGETGKTIYNALTNDFSTAYAEGTLASEDISNLSTTFSAAYTAAKAFDEEVAVAKTLGVDVSAYEIKEFADADEVIAAVENLKTVEYAQVNADYTQNAAALIPDFAEWEGGMVSNKGQHWDGTTTSTYYEQTSAQWSQSNWTNNKKTTVNLPKGKYVLYAAGRVSEGTACTAYIKVNDEMRIYSSKGDTGYGVATDGTGTFDTNATYANDGKGRGFEYRYIAFEVTADKGEDITLEIGGSATDKKQWMSFTAPVLLTTADNGAIAKKMLTADLATAQAIVENKAGVGEDLFMIPTEAFETFEAAVNDAKAVNDKAGATTTEVQTAIEALTAAIETYNNTPVNAPDPTKQYAFRLKDSKTLYMNLTDGIKIKEEATPLSFVAAEAGKYYLAAEGGLYVGLKSGSTWSMTTEADRHIACDFTALGNGEYHIHNTNGLVGTDNTENGSSCFANKGTGNHVVWIIEEVSVATMSVNAGKWGTFVAPFDVAIPEGIKAYTVTGVENSQIVKTEVEDTIPANTPVVLLNETEEDIEKTLTGVGLPESETVTEGQLTGIYQTGIDIPAGSYVLQTQSEHGQAFYHVKDAIAGQGVANRCYLTMPASSAPLRAIFFGSEEGTTGIEATEATSAEDGVLYNLAGQKVDASYKGIVVKQGKAMLKK